MGPLEKRLQRFHETDNELEVALQGCKKNETQGFAKLDNGAKIVGIDVTISSPKIAPAEQSKKRKAQTNPECRSRH